MKTPSPRACYGEIAIYSPATGAKRVDLSDNTNLWGMPPGAERAVRALSSQDISRYPQPYSAELKQRIAEYCGVAPEMIVVGCGSDDIIDSTFRAFAEPGEAVSFPDPTFSMVPVFAMMNGLAPIAVPPVNHLDIEPLLAANARITYLCTPNNPTGGELSRSTLEAIVGRATGIVVVDEAYAEFAGASNADLADTGRVVVTRTMSKAFGLAGLRIGYGIAAPEIVAAIEKARGPYKVNVVAEAAAIAALTEDGGWVKARVDDAVTNRERFATGLRALGYAPLASRANFVLLPVADCGATADRLSDAGIAVRGFRSLAGIGDALRITIGPWEMMQECLDALGPLG